jgi:predicted nucleic acid-binding protein
MAFVLEDEANSDTDAILERLGRDASALAPALWWWEVANVLLIAERRKRVTIPEIHRHLTSLHALPVEFDEMAPRQSWSAGLLLAGKHRLTLYDTAYLELAIRHGVPLGSLDAELRQAAKSERVELLPKRI